jgi:carbohydrate-selective porin OprB
LCSVAGVAYFGTPTAEEPHRRMGMDGRVHNDRWQAKEEEGWVRGERGNGRRVLCARMLAGAAGVIILLGSLFVAPAQAQLLDVLKTYAGDLWSRPRLTGDWFGVRDELATRGIWLDVDWVQALQGVGSGGRDTGVEYGGHVDYRLHVDFQKLGLWPGGFLTLLAESQYGHSVNQKASALVLVNTALCPLLGEILADRVPIFGQLLSQVAQADIRTNSGSWSLYYNCDQYLWTRQEDPTQGVGGFFRFGVSDGQANPIKYHYNMDLGARAWSPGVPATRSASAGRMSS